MPFTSALFLGAAFLLHLRRSGSDPHLSAHLLPWATLSSCLTSIGAIWRNIARVYVMVGLTPVLHLVCVTLGLSLGQRSSVKVSVSGFGAPSARCVLFQRHFLHTPFHPPTFRCALASSLVLLRIESPYFPLFFPLPFLPLALPSSVLLSFL